MKPGKRRKKIVLPDRPLPLRRAITETIFRRKDSSLWQAKFAGPDGTLMRRSTGTRSRTAAMQFLALLKAEAKRVSELPPPETRASDARVPELFDL